MKYNNEKEIFKQFLEKENIHINKKFDFNNQIKNKRYEKKTKDLHGLNRYEAQRMVKALISSYKVSKVKQLKLICGKGKHSQDKPVLFDYIYNFLKTKNNNEYKIKTDKNNNIYIIWN